MKKSNPVEAGLTTSQRPSPRFERISVTSTEAQNEVWSLIDSVKGDRVIVITRHNAPRAVLMSYDRFDALAGSDVALLSTLTKKYDAMLEKMQTPEVRSATRRVFAASPEEVRLAAIAAARDDAR